MASVSRKAANTDLPLEMNLQTKVQEWLEWDKNPETANSIKDLWLSPKSDKRDKLLKALLLCRLEFGTAGLRGRMEAGYSRMNDLVIIQTSQGLAVYTEGLNLANAKERGVAIGFDGRHHSKRFAGLTAGIFLRRGFKVYLFSEVCPTPFVPFCVKEYNCVVGIMVTASHNPKQDNGYKVYWENGAQIVPPRDRAIQSSILDNLQPWEGTHDLTILEGNVLLTDPLSQVSEKYFDLLKGNVLSPDHNKASTIKITYTAMHGVGYSFMEKAFEVANLNPLTVVVEQRDPDPDFPTVAFPNPEEGKSALDLSFQTADKNGCTLILANDPDADRLAVAEKMDEDGWRIFNGNELGILLGWWMFHSYRKRNGNVKLEDLYMLGSTVSTKFLQTMARIEGFNYEETLTGFKWMGNRAHALMEEGKRVLFAFEEAIGFMCGTAVLDKDGISAGVHAAELAAYLDNTQGMTLADKLEDLYSKYGCHVSKNSYFLCYDPVSIETLFNRLRIFEGKINTYPESLADGKYKVCSVRDLTTGYDSAQPDEKARLPVSASSQMITFTFENGMVTTLRTSGTEPKVKYYTELHTEPGKEDTRSLLDILDKMVQAVINEWMMPKAYGLVCKDD